MKDKQPFNPDRLRLLRESLGIFQAKLSRELGITQAALSKLESGSISPSENVLKKISSYFGYPIEYFLEDTQFIPSGLVFHRKRTTLPATLRIQLEAEAKLRALDILKMRKKVSFVSNLINREERSPEECARLLRGHWNVDANCPIDNLIELCEKNGVLILTFDFGTDKIDGFFLSLLESQIILIILNDAEVFTPDRRRFSLAHELGHAVLHQYNFPDKGTEDEANRFAAEFLAPKGGIGPDLRKSNTCKKFLSLKELFELKKKWKISMAAILYRAKSLNLIDESDYRRLCVYMSSQGYRKREPLAGITLEQPNLLERLFQKCSQEVSESMQNFLELPDFTFKSRYSFRETNRGRMSP